MQNKVQKENMTNKQKMISTFGWGFVLWLVGYIAGIVLFMLVPENMIGWIITPFATIFTLWVLFKRIKRSELMCYFGLGLVWTVMAIVLDYFFIVKLFQSDSYYKPDIFLYYTLTFTLPLIVGYWKFKNKSEETEWF